MTFGIQTDTGDLTEKLKGTKNPLKNDFNKIKKNLSAANQKLLNILL